MCCLSHPLDELISIYDKVGSQSYKNLDGITQKAHVLQSAYLAQICGAPEDVIISLLFHDVGYFLKDNQDIYDDSDFGAEWLECEGFPLLCSDFVKYLCIAKVTLCMEEPLYYSSLPKVSQESYKVQRDKFLAQHLYKKSHAQAKSVFDQFNEHPKKEILKSARMCEDMAKVPYFDTEHTYITAEETDRVSLPFFKSYLEMTNRVLKGEEKGASNPNWQKNIHNLYFFMISSPQKFAQTLQNCTDFDFAEIELNNQKFLTSLPIENFYILESTLSNNTKVKRGF